MKLKFVEREIIESLTRLQERVSELLQFTERNAGPMIDEHMEEQGFEVQAAVAWETGFVFGGNEHNCGTWMDKMGSSKKAGNKGRPATPRDGAAVELVGLCAETLAWLDEAHRHGHYPHPGVTRKFSACPALPTAVIHSITCIYVVNADNEHWTWGAWLDRIKRNFDRCFWLPVDETEYLDPSATEKERIATRGIFKDSYGATTPWADYQFRPNFCITLAVVSRFVSGSHVFTTPSRFGRHFSPTPNTLT